MPVTSPASEPVKFVALPAVDALPLSGPLNVPVVVPVKVSPEASWLLPTAPLAMLADPTAPDASCVVPTAPLASFVDVIAPSLMLSAINA